MSPRRPLALALLASLLALPAAAEIFRYTDEEGRVHFVSSESQIPPRYRSRAGEAASGEVNRMAPEVSGAHKESSEQRLQHLRSLNRHLDRAGPAPVPARTAPAGPSAPAPEPRKYIRDCRLRNANGRCGRRLSPEWSAWKRLHPTATVPSADE